MAPKLKFRSYLAGVWTIADVRASHTRTEIGYHWAALASTCHVTHTQHNICSRVVVYIWCACTYTSVVDIVCTRFRRSCVYVIPAFPVVHKHKSTESSSNHVMDVFQRIYSTALRDKHVQQKHSQPVCSSALCVNQLSMARRRVDRRSLQGHLSQDDILFSRSTLCANAGVVMCHFGREQREKRTMRVHFEGYSAGVGSDPLVMGVAEKSRKWCQKGSWAICTICKSLHRQKLDMNKFEQDFWDTTFPHGLFCKRRLYVPGLYDCPSPLTHLSQAQVWAHRPWHLFQGPTHVDKADFVGIQRLASFDGSCDTRASCDTAHAGNARGKNSSVKQASLAKVCSPVMEKALQFDLLQFHFDRHVVTKFMGVQKNAQQINSQRVLKIFPDSPHDLHLNKLAMVELNQQLERATSMVTLAPGPCATTWSEPVQHTRDLSGARVLGDNALQALDRIPFLISCANGSCSTAITPQNAFQVRLQCSVVQVVKRACKHGRIALNSKAENTEPRQGSHVACTMVLECLTDTLPTGRTTN